MSSSSIIRLPLCAILLPNRDLSFQSVQNHRKLFEKKYLSEPPVDVSYNEALEVNSTNDTLSLIHEENQTTHTITEDNDDNTSNILEDDIDTASEGIFLDNVQSPTTTTTAPQQANSCSDEDSVSSQHSIAIPIRSLSPSNISSPSSPVSISQLSSSPTTPNSFLSRKNSSNGVKSSNTSNEELLSNLEVLRNRYLEYLVENNAFKIPNVCGRYEMMLTFMDYVFDPINRKPSLKIKDFNELLRVMDAFCHSSLWLMGNEEEIEWIKSEGESNKITSSTKSLSIDTDLPFLEYFVTKIIPMRNQGRAYRWFHHVRLGQFLEKIYKIHKTGQSFIFKTESCDETSSINNQSNETSQASLMDEVQLICDMLHTILEDTFVAFQHKHYKFVKKWTEKGIKQNTLPRFLIECYKKKNEYNQEMQSSANKLTVDDLSMKYVIDRDWKLSKYLAKEYSSDWFMTYFDKGRVVQWASDKDYSDGLQLRLTKNVGVFEYPIENIVKALHYDNHLDYTFSNLRYHTYSSIDASNSMKKYPSVLLNADLLLGPLFSTRSFNVICSTQAKFVGDELTETYILFKSCDMNSSNNSEKVKFPYVGLRVLTKIDNHRTRYVELRMGNAGGFASAKKITFSSLMAKKLTSENYNGLLNCIKRCEKTNFQAPKPSENTLAKNLAEYCKKYCNIDLESRWK